MYSKVKIIKGKIIKKKNIFFKLPALGIRSRDINEYINKYKVNKTINANEPIFLEDLTL